MGGNGMDKGDFGSSLGSEMFMKIHRFSLSPAAADHLRRSPASRLDSLRSHRSPGNASLFD